jgi:hypothetical protein
MPDTFDGEVCLAITLMILGFLAILVIERWAKREDQGSIGRQ